jgi:Uncharacterised nucleotidyltransferase
MFDKHGNGPFEIAVNCSPEFRLALACARWPLQSQERDEIRALASAPVDWNRFVRTIRHHQILPLAYRNLHDCLTEDRSPIIAMLLPQLFSLTRRSRNQITEMIQIVELFEAAGVEPIALKGAVLSKLAFGDPAMRTCVDLDLLVSAARVSDVDRLMREAHYNRIAPAASLTSRRLDHYLKYHKHFVYVSETREMVVEIHWRLFSSAFLWSESGNEPLSTMSVEVGTRALKTLSRIDLFLYLCVHGAIHRFAILKWIADIAAMLRAMTREEFAQVVARASSLGVTAERVAALVLIERMLSVSAPCPIASGKADSQAMRIVEASYAMLTKEESFRNARQVSRIHRLLYRLRLRSRWRYRHEQMVGVAIRPADWEVIDLPDPLFWLYMGIAPFGWLLRHQSSTHSGGSGEPSAMPDHDSLSRD